MSGTIRTLTGDVPAGDLGRTLVHEHFTVDWGEMLGRPNKLDFDYAEMVQTLVGKLDDLHAAGIGGLAECTPYGAGHYVDLFADVARRSRVKIIASTGFFHESWCPMHPLAVALDIDGLEEFFVREITQGMGSTLVRAGLIKVAVGDGRISPNEEKVLRAAARARRRTGCPIIVHTTNRMGPEVLDLFESERVEAPEVIISHVGHESDPTAYAESLLRRGANVSFDRVGFHAFLPDEHWIRLISWAVAGGWVSQVLLSHDASTFNYGLELAAGDKVHGDYTYISRRFVPKLKAAGITAEQIETILAANPQRVLALGSSS